MILMVSRSPDVAGAQCPGAYICVWNGTNYSGSKEAQINDAAEGEEWVNVGAVLNAEESVQNRTSFRYWMEQFQNSGNELCINPWQDIPDVNSANDHDYWGLVTTIKSNCP
jgi:hypothetical protein